jgi:hypothetical protein
LSLDHCLHPLPAIPRTHTYFLSHLRLFQIVATCHWIIVFIHCLPFSELIHISWAVSNFLQYFRSGLC